MFKQRHGKPTETCLKTMRFLCVFMFYHILCSDFFSINILLWCTKKLLVAIMCIDDIKKYKYMYCRISIIVKENANVKWLFIWFLNALSYHLYSVIAKLFIQYVYCRCFVGILTVLISTKLSRHPFTSCFWLSFNHLIIKYK